MASTIVLTPSADQTGAADTAAISRGRAAGRCGRISKRAARPGRLVHRRTAGHPGRDRAGGHQGRDQRAHLDLSRRFRDPPGRGFQRAGHAEPVGRFRGADTGPRHSQRHQAHRRPTWTGSPATATSTAWRSCASRSPWSAATGWLTTGWLAAGDGLWMSRCMFQRTGKSAVHRPVNDANIHNVHIQYAWHRRRGRGQPWFLLGCGIGGNMTYVGCRADLCRGSGWLISPTVTQAGGYEHSHLAAGRAGGPGLERDRHGRLALGLPGEPGSISPSSARPRPWGRPSSPRAAPGRSPSSPPAAPMPAPSPG